MHPIPLSVDPLACVLAAIAIWLAWRAYRRSTMHIVRLDSVKNGFTIGNAGTRTGPSFEVTLSNEGLPINAITVSLHFHMLAPFGQSTFIGLEATEEHKTAAFEPGMKASFARWPQDDPPANCEHLLRWIAALTHPRKQRAEIVVRSGGFDVQTIPLYARLDRVRIHWNRLLHSLLSRFDQTIRSFLSNNCPFCAHLGDLPSFGFRISDLRLRRARTEHGFEYRNPFAWWRRFTFESPHSEQLLSFVRQCNSLVERENRRQEDEKQRDDSKS